MSTWGANPVTIYRSSVAGHIPVSLYPGQIGINEADSLLFFRNPAGAVTSMSLLGGSGSGNVSTSGTPTSGQIAKWTDATHIQGVDSISISQMPQGTNGQLIVGLTGSAPAYRTITGDIGVSAAGVCSIVSSVGLTGNPTAPTPSAGDNDNSIATTAFVQSSAVRFDLAQTLNATQQRQAQTNMAAQKLHGIGQCYLTYSGLNVLQLKPEGGNLLWINGALEVIPDAGVTLAATGNAATTLYYIYAYMSAGVMTLEYSTTAYAVQAGTGVRIKSGDATRTLVGMWSSYTGAASWSGTGSGYVTEGASYFNPKSKTQTNNVGAPTTTSTSFVEIASAFRIPFITFADREVQFGIRGRVNTSTASAGATFDVTLDGIATNLLIDRITSIAASTTDYTFFSDRSSAVFTEARHYITGIYRVSAGTLNLDMCGFSAAIQG